MAADEPDGKRKLVRARNAWMNAQSAGAGIFYEGHRRHVMELLLPAGSPLGGMLCVLGAGNCNDIDVDRLATHFEQVHLVDVDAEALARSTPRHGAARDAVLVHGGVDITGIIADLEKFRGPLFATEDIRRCASKAEAPPELPCGKGFDVVLSAGILTQLTEAVVQVLGAHHQSTHELADAVRRGHLRLVRKLLAPRGKGILVIDLVSSDTFGGLLSLPEEPHPSIVWDLVRQGNFFRGMDPSGIANDLFSTAGTSGVISVQLHRPWRWQIGTRRFFLMYAMSFRAAAPGPNARVC